MTEEANRTITDETMRELAGHGCAAYPFRQYEEEIGAHALQAIDWHWHSEVEFVFVREGTAVCFAGSERHVLPEGSGIFINARVIHRLEAEARAVIPNIVFSPAFLAAPDSLIYQSYVQPVLDSDSACLVFSPKEDAQKRILDALLSVLALAQRESACELETAERTLRLWGTMLENAAIQPRRLPADSSAQARARLQIMMQYLQTNYRRRITLEELAAVVSLSKSSVRNLFQEYLHTAPIRYLVEYRLRQGAKLLANTERGVAAVAKDVGFEHAGYFCRKFKGLFGMTPKEYRKRTSGRYAAPQPDAEQSPPPADIFPPGSAREIDKIADFCIMNCSE